MYVHRVPYDRIRFYGAVNTVRGTYAFQGRQFTILRGTAPFGSTASTSSTPGSIIRAERIIQGVTANVNVRGDFKQPEIVLTSMPPLEQADILSLIVFNQPINQLGTGEQMIAGPARAGAGHRGRGHAAGQSIGSALDVDIVRDQHGARQRRRRGDDDRAADRTEPVREGAAGDRRSEPDQLHPRIRARRVAPAADERRCRDPPSSSSYFERMQGSGVDLLFFFSY